MGRHDDAPRPRYAGCRDPAGIIATAVWLYSRFPLSLRMVEELPAAHGINRRRAGGGHRRR